MDKWEKMKRWVGKRHNYLEKEYIENNLSADGLELGVFRKLFQVMLDFDEQEKRGQPQNPTVPPRPAPPPAPEVG